MDQPHRYALSNIYLLVGQNELVGGLFSSGNIFYKSLLSFHEIMLACILFTVTTGAILRLYLSSCRRAAGLKISETDRMILALHVLFLCFFTAQLYPWTMISFELLFESSGITLLASKHILVMLAFLSKTALYLIEGTFRSIVRPNSFLIMHHLLFAVFILIAFGTRDVLALKVDIILDNMAIFEVLLYAGLIARRLAAPYRLTQGLLTSGIVLYGLTRLIQAFLLIYILAGSYSRMLRSSNIALWWILLLGCLALALLQVYTFPIYLGIIRRTRTKHLQAQQATKLACLTSSDVDIEAQC